MFGVEGVMSRDGNGLVWSCGFSTNKSFQTVAAAAAAAEARCQGNNLIETTTLCLNARNY